MSKSNSIFIVKVFDYDKETSRRFYFSNFEDAQMFHFKAFCNGGQNNLFVLDTIEEVSILESADDVVNFEEKISTFHRAGS